MGRVAKYPPQAYNGCMDRPLCSICNKNLAMKGHKPGFFKKKCFKCSRGYSRSQMKVYTVDSRKGPLCERCGFIPEHACQLDVDHINGIHDDNRPDNLQTLCANCHRLKTHINGENRRRELRQGG